MEFDWDRLLDLIRKREVIPVVGRELCTLTEQERQVPLESHLASHLARESGLPLESSREWSLQRLAMHPSLASTEQQDRLYARLYKFMRDLKARPPETLQQLAEIDDFRLYVSTTFDSLLIDAINERRYGGAKHTRSLSYSPKGRPVDLAPEGLDAKYPTVFRMFGRVTPDPRDYAVTEEDTLEFLHALQSETRRPRRLFDELRRHHLVLLGCGFPDWLSRFFLRTVKNERLLESRTFKWLADDGARRESDLVVFVSHYRTQVWADGSSADFVRELRRQWGALQSDTRAIPDDDLMPPGMVFLSYAHEDTARVREVKASLVQRGFQVWYDKEAIEKGADWARKIRVGVERAAVFVPCISRSTEGRSEGYFRTEWEIACRRNKRFFGTERRFLMPVLLDELGAGPSKIPQEFEAVQMARWSSEASAFMDDVETEIRSLQVAGELTEA